MDEAESLATISAAASCSHINVCPWEISLKLSRYGPILSLRVGTPAPYLHCSDGLWNLLVPVISVVLGGSSTLLLSVMFLICKLGTIGPSLGLLGGALRAEMGFCVWTRPGPRTSVKVPVGNWVKLGGSGAWAYHPQPRKEEVTMDGICWCASHGQTTSLTRSVG